MRPTRWFRSAMLTTVAAGAMAAPAAAQAPPPLPPAPVLPTLPAGDVERFGLTVSGYQLDKLDFTFNPVPNVPCPLLADGSVQEYWRFERGRRVVMEFRRLGPGVVVVGRAGRAPGDTAFATQGDLRRHVTGFVQLASATACPTFPLTTPACDRSFSAPTDLRLTHERGALSLLLSGRKRVTPNPAAECGHSPKLNFGDSLNWAYPELHMQSVRLPLRRIFDSRRNLRLVLKANFLRDPDVPAGYGKFNETLRGQTTVTLTRLSAR